MDLLCFSVLCLLCLCARLFVCAFWSPAGKGLTSWLSFVVSNCEFVTFPLVSWVKCDTKLYLFLIFAPLLTFLMGITASVDTALLKNCRKVKVWLERLEGVDTMSLYTLGG